MRLKTETIVGLFFLSALALFIYLSIFFGAWRFNAADYATYIIFSRDCSGLMKKADVKIAGVKVGYVDDIALTADKQQVHIVIKIGKNYRLYTDASALLRQEGILGTKYLELVPGNPTLPILTTGDAIASPSKQGVSFDEVLSEIHGITQEMHAMSIAIKHSMMQAQEQGPSLIQAVHETMAHVAQLTRSLEDFMLQNQHHVQGLLQNSHTLTDVLKREMPQLTDKIHTISDLMEDVLDPLERVVGHVGAGKGTMGKLIHDDEIYDDIKATTNTVKSCINTFNSLALVFDAHTESLHGIGQESHCFKNSKDYFNIRLHPCADYFYLLGVLMSHYGSVNRHETFKTIDVCEPIFHEQTHKKMVKRKLNAVLFNAQFGKIYKNWALRFGIFESTPGVAVDCELPCPRWLRWVSTFEIFDFNGRNRLCGSQPHLKWLNRMFITDHIYFDWGCDDFASPQNKTAFFGAGLRFEDTDFRNFAERCIGKDYPPELG